MSWVTNYSLILVRNFSAREITQFRRKPSVRLSAIMATNFSNVLNEDVRALKDA